ncbi:MAG: hypothetical protein R3359_01975 [Marinirhabdus sp.]|nr:hypothetical protein [Marinirhabdus sp.]
MPSSYAALAEYMDDEAENIEVLVLGSSQMKSGINPEYISQPTLNLAAGNQHHDTDFKLLKQLIDRFPKLQTVVLETSYSHFELPHNGKRFWKNVIYLQYYGVNAFERPTYFKDRLIYLANPSFYSERLLDSYSDERRRYGFNSFGYDTLNFPGTFKNLQYDEKRIADLEIFKINTIPDALIFQENTALFHEMLSFLEAHEIQVVLCQPPMYKTYLPRRNPNILRRRDSVVRAAANHYPNVSVFALETDTLAFSVRDFWNQSHVNPRGGKTFSRLLDTHLQSLYP